MKSIITKFLPKKFVRFLKKIKSGNYSYYFWLFPIKNNKIVVCNFYGKAYGDNGKYIVEEIIRQKLNYDIVWLLKKELIGSSQFPSQIHLVKYGSLRALYELATAKVWIDNCRKAFYPPKRKKQYYIQTWHGGIGVKKVEKAAEEKLGDEYIVTAKSDSKMADLMISNSDFCTQDYKESFWYSGEILEAGLPRNDIFFRKENIDIEIRKKLRIDNNVNVVLYAPTFRNNESLFSYFLNFERVLDTLSKRFGGKWVMVVRLHPNVSHLNNHINYDKRIINGSNYNDMQELLLISEILITDYSSSAFDFVLKNKPVFLYCTDYNEYVNERGFKINVRNIGFPFAETEDELVEKIISFKHRDYDEILNQLFRKYGYKEDGNASQKVVEIINNKIRR